MSPIKKLKIINVSLQTRVELNSKINMTNMNRQVPIFPQKYTPTTETLLQVLRNNDSLLGGTTISQEKCDIQKDMKSP
jgi:hypothetical protein